MYYISNSIVAMDQASILSVGGLREFLPKFVSAIPAFRASVVVFLVCLAISYFLYTRYISNKLSHNTQIVDKRIHELKTNIINALYILVAISVSLLVANKIFDFRIWYDNFAVNKDWIVYKRYFPALFT